MITEEVRKWLNHNFPNQEVNEPILGMIEELGELSHQVLKTMQRIREPSEGQTKDAIADIAVYLCNYCIKINCPFDRLFNEVITEQHRIINQEGSLSVIKIILRIQSNIGFLAESDYAAPYVHNILYYLNQFCKSNQWDFVTVLQDVWNIVKTRDWVKYPTTGRPM